MIKLIRLMALLLVICAPLNIIAQTVKPMNVYTIKRVLAHHKKDEQITVKLKSGEQINGTLNNWNQNSLTIENYKNYDKRVIALTDIAHLRFHQELKNSVTSAKRDLLTIGSTSLNIFMLFTTGKMLTKDN